MSFEVGDKVIDLVHGEGTIVIKAPDCVKASFMTPNGPTHFLYLPDGYYTRSDAYPMLYHAEGFTPPSCKEPERNPKCCNFMPFDKVLVRDSKEDEWTIEFFSYFDPSATAPYRCLNEWWVYCIPYETNEDKCGKVTEE